MSQQDKAIYFKTLHVKGSPIILYNIWDAGGAKALEKINAKAIATGSHPIATAHGYADGQNIPLNFALQICRRVVEAVDLPVSIDFEGAYAIAPDDIENNVAKLLDTGAIGLNFEDQIIGTDALYSIEEQSKRIQAVRRACEAKSIPAIINARTDLFLKEKDQTQHPVLIEEALIRACHYEQAGADCFFVPGLGTPDLIREICKRVALPVNILIRDPYADLKPLYELGPARISFGPSPFLAAMDNLSKMAAKHF